MALPRVISTDPSFAGIGFLSRPFFLNGAVYWIGVVSGTFRAYKSTNPVDNAFAEQDTGNRPTDSTNITALYSIYSDGSKLHCVSSGTGTADSIVYARFNPSADTWDVITGSARQITVYTPGNSFVAADCPKVTVRGDGDIVICHKGDREKIHGTDYERVGYSVSSDGGQTWGYTEVFITGTTESFRSPAIVLGDSDTSHLFGQEHGTGSGNDMVQRALSSGDVLQTLRTNVDGTNNIADSNQVNIGLGIRFTRSSTTKLRLCYQGGVGSIDFFVTAFDAAADPSAFSSLTVELDTVPNPQRICFDLAADGDVVYCVYADTGNSGQIYYENDSGSDTWTGSATQIGSASSITNIQCNIYTRSGLKVLAVVYHDGSDDPVYDEVTLSSNPSIEVPKAILSIEPRTPTLTQQLVVAPPKTALSIETYAPILTVTSDVSKEVPKASLSIETYAPSVTQAIRIEPPKASLSIETYAPVVSISPFIEVPEAILAIVPKTPTIVLGSTIEPPQAILSIETYAPILTQDIVVEVPQASLSIETYAPVVTVQHAIEVPKATLGIATKTPTVTLGFTIEPPQANLSIETYAPVVTQQLFVEVPKATLSIETYAPTATVFSGTIEPPQAVLAIKTYAPIVTISPYIEVPKLGNTASGDFKVGVVRASSDTVASTQDITLSGFGTVKGAIAFMISDTTDGVGQGSFSYSIGLSDGSTHKNLESTSEDGQTATDTSRGMQEDTLVEPLNFGELSRRAGATEAFITDGVRLTWAINPPEADLIALMLFGGDGLSVFRGDEFTGTDVTGLSITPTGFFNIFHAATANSVAGDTSINSIGMAADGASVTQASISQSVLAGAGTSNVDGRIANNRALLTQLSGSVIRSMIVSAFNSDGWSRSNIGSSQDYGYLTFGGMRCHVLTGDTPTSTGVQPYTGVPFKPQGGILIASDHADWDTSKIDGTGGVVTCTMFDGSNAYGIVFGDKDGVTTTKVTVGAISKLIAIYDHDGTLLVEGTLDSFNSDGLSINFTTVSGTARKFAILLFEGGANSFGIVPKTPVVTQQLRIEVPKATLSIETYAPVISAPVTIEVPKTALSIETYAPIVTSDGNVSKQVPQAQLSIETYAPIVTQQHYIEVPQAQLSIEPYAPIVSVATTIEVPQAQLSIEPYAPVVTTQHYIEVPQATLSIEPYAPLINVSGAIVIPQATLSIETYAPLITVQHNIEVPKVTLEIATKTPGVNVGLTTPVPKALLGLVMKTPGVTVQHRVEVPQAQLAINTKAPVVTIQHNIIVPQADLTIVTKAPTANVGFVASPAATTLGLVPKTPVLTLDIIRAPPQALLGINTHAPIVSTTDSPFIQVPKALLSIEPFAPLITLGHYIEVPQVTSEGTTGGNIRVIRQSAPTSTGTQDFTASGFGTPKAALFVCINRTADGAARGDYAYSFGWTDGTTHFTTGATSRDNVPSADNSRFIDKDFVVATLNPGDTAFRSLASWDSWIADGVRINWTDAPPDADLVICMLFKGAGVQVTSGRHTRGSNLTSLSYEPSGVLACYGLMNGTDTVLIDAEQFPFGAAANQTSIEQACLFMSQLNNLTVSSTRGHISDDSFVDTHLAGTTRTNTITAFTPTGYTRNNVGTPTNQNIFFLALAGIEMTVRVRDFPTSTGNATITGLPIKPQGGIFLVSDHDTLNTTEINGTGAIISMGLFDDSSQFSAIFGSRDNVTQMEVLQGASSKAISMYDHTRTLIGEATVTGFTNDGYTLNVTTAPGTARKYVEILFGEVSGSFGFRMKTPVVTVQHRIEVPKATLAIKTKTPAIFESQDFSITVPQAQLGIKTYTPIVSAGKIEIPKTSLTFQMKVPVIDVSYYIEIPAAKLGIRTATPNVPGNTTIEPPVAKLGIKTYAPELHYKVTVPKAHLGIVTKAPQAVVAPIGTIIPQAVGFGIRTYPPIVISPVDLTITPGKATIGIKTYAPQVTIVDAFVVEVPAVKLGIRTAALTNSATIVVPGFKLALKLKNANSTARVEPQSIKLGITTYAPIVTAPLWFSPPQAKLGFSMKTPLVIVDGVIVPKTKLGIRTYAPIVTVQERVEVPQAKLGIATKAPFAGRDYDVTVPKTRLGIRTYAPTITIRHVVIPQFKLAIKTYAPIVSSPFNEGFGDWSGEMTKKDTFWTEEGKAADTWSEESKLLDSWTEEEDIC